MHQPPWFFEVFAGTAGLSRSCANKGFRILAFDHRLEKAQAPVANLDMALESRRVVFWDLLRKCRPFHIHLGVPAGSAAASHYTGKLKTKAQAALRTASHCLGTPQASKSAQSTRVRRENATFRFCFDLLCYCVDNKISICLENPANSLLWMILEQFAKHSRRLWPPSELEFTSFAM